MAECLRRLRDSSGRLHRSSLGQDLIEYALIAAMLGLATIAAAQPVANVFNTGVSKIGKKFKEHVDRGLHKGWYK